MRAFADLPKFIQKEAPSALTPIPRHLNHPLVTHRALIINAHSITNALHFSDLADPTRFVRGWHELLKDVGALEGGKATIVLPPVRADGKGWLRPTLSSTPPPPSSDPDPQLSTTLSPLHGRLLWISSLRSAALTLSTSSSSSSAPPPPLSSLPKPKPPLSTSTTPSILRGWAEDQAFWIKLRSLSSSSSDEFNDAITTHRRSIAKQLWLKERQDSRPTVEDQEEVLQVMRLMGVKVVRTSAREGGESVERVCRRLVWEEGKMEGGGEEGLVLSASYLPLLYGSSTLHYTPPTPIPTPILTPFTHASLPLLLSSLFPSSSSSSPSAALTSFVNLCLLTGSSRPYVPKIPQVGFVRAFNAITDYGSPENIDLKEWKWVRNVDGGKKNWAQWLECLGRAREEFRVVEAEGEEKGWVEEKEEQGEMEERQALLWDEFWKETVEGRKERERGEEFWESVADELESRKEE
ncbi:hypothetical protein BDY24DRAFT_229139 [Mrakia frigida]|uniref:uncharacterized protein n=1 Tax=Mrakia frigida TaxID=29902 RepID=UPI003FCBF4B1